MIDEATSPVGAIVVVRVEPYKGWVGQIRLYRESKISRKRGAELTDPISGYFYGFFKLENLDQSSSGPGIVVPTFSSHMVIEDKPVSISTPKSTCEGCSQEISEYLDAYYGKDPSGHRNCIKCRSFGSIRTHAP